MEGGVSQPHPRGALATLSSARYSYSTPIVEGEEDLSVTATVVFAIE
jgi:hypothetical protein